jgi:nitrite reductase/ring-hydroxylating ferredoxin subunit
MGNLLRRYWMPALLSVEVPEPDSPPVRVRLLGEDLVAFRDSEGSVGLFTQSCPHRGASLFFGRNEESGLRCVYHGWKFDVSGACVDMPSEPAESNFKSKVRVVAYPARESGGVIWAYLGPAGKQPGFRDYGQESLRKDQWRATKTLSFCNWVQALEGNIDTAHISFLHGGRPPGAPPRAADGTEFDQPGYPPPGARGQRAQNPDLDLFDTWYGFRYAGLRRTPKGYLNARVSDFIMPIFTYVPPPYGPIGGDNLSMMVPIDDSNCWRMSFSTKPFKLPEHAEQAAQAAQVFRSGVIDRPWLPENDYLIDRELQRTTTYTGIQPIGPQDMAVTESMGAIYDRTNERLGTTDRAIIRFRRMLINAAKDLEKGIEPPALDAAMAFDEIRSAERILDHDQSWRDLGTDKDPMLQPPIAPLAR